jgi:hypothetical protein
MLEQTTLKAFPVNVSAPVGTPVIVRVAVDAPAVTAKVWVVGLPEAGVVTIRMHCAPVGATVS